jgi:multidrug efflux pump subunit AcrB
MSWRQNNIVCSFDRQSPRLSAYEIHEWFGANLTSKVEDVLLVQIHGAQRQVYIKFREYTTMNHILTTSRVEGTVRHANGEISTARIEIVGMGTKRVRLANLPPNFLTDRYTKH